MSTVERPIASNLPCWPATWDQGSDIIVVNGKFKPFIEERGTRLACWNQAYFKVGSFLAPGKEDPHVISVVFAQDLRFLL
jgi:hypothetical protein